MGFDFYKFLVASKNSDNLYILGEVVHNQAVRQRDDLKNKKRTFYRMTTLHAKPRYKSSHYTEPFHHITL